MISHDDFTVTEMGLCIWRCPNRGVSIAHPSVTRLGELASTHMHEKVTT